MQYFVGVYTSYFTLYSKKLFLKRRCMHEYAFFMHRFFLLLPQISFYFLAAGDIHHAPDHHP